MDCKPNFVNGVADSVFSPFHENKQKKVTFLFWRLLKYDRGYLHVSPR